MNQNWQESRKEQSLPATCQEARKAAAQRQNSLEAEAGLRALAGSFISFLTVCLPLHDAVWHPSGSDPYNILRCWGRCCLYQSAGQPWADCSASPSLILVAPAGSAAEKYHQRKGVNHTYAETRTLFQTLDSFFPQVTKMHCAHHLICEDLQICRCSLQQKKKTRLLVNASVFG